MNRPPIPPEHRPIIAKVGRLLLEYALAKQAKKGEDAAAQPPPTTEDLPVIKPLPL